MAEHIEQPEEDDGWGAVAQAFEQAEDQEDDGPPLNILSGEASSGFEFEKIPLDKAGNLVLLREAAEQIRHDEISAEEFVEKVMQVTELAENGIKLFASEALKKETAKLPPEQIELVNLFEKQIYAVKEGTTLMASYADSGNIDDLDRGLDIVERALQIVDEIQDDAIEIDDYEKANPRESTPVPVEDAEG
ncbi:hypothetical protein IV102_16625 [bacterium]|nr:hypothetical protein [bacterium]